MELMEFKTKCAATIVAKLSCLLANFSSLAYKEKIVSGGLAHKSWKRLDTLLEIDSFRGRM
jgi:hypothetical protein